MSTPVHAPAQARANASPTAQTGALSRATREHEAAEPVPESVREAVRSGGQPLDAGTRETMGARFGHDFSHIPLYPAQKAEMQTKLKINQPGDVYEQEADRVAEQVMNIADLGAPISDGEHHAKNFLMRKQSEESQTSVSSVPPAIQSVLGSSEGQPLDTTTRAFMEPRFGHDFSNVRVHTGMQANKSSRVFNALSYTIGTNLFFDKGEYAPGTSKGRRLLAHELTHVIQQNRFPEKSGIVKENAPSLLVQRYVSPLDIVDYIGVTYDVGERIYLGYFYKGSDKEFQLFLNLFFMALDLAMAALPGVGGGGVAARASRGALAFTWHAVPNSVKEQIIAKIAAQMAWSIAKASRFIGQLMMAGNQEGGGSTSDASHDKGETPGQPEQKENKGPEQKSESKATEPTSEKTQMPSVDTASIAKEEFAKKVGLNVKSPTTKQILDNLDTPVTVYIGKYRKASVRSEFPKEFLKEGVTVREALLKGGSTVRKLLVDGRFAK